jgi:hypothetical protein
MIHAERKNWTWRGVTLGCVTGLIAGAIIFAWSFVVHPVGKIEVGGTFSHHSEQGSIRQWTVRSIFRRDLTQ